MIDLLTALTAGSFFLLAFIVAVNPKQVNKTANRWLAVFLLCVALIVLDDPLLHQKFYHQYPFFIGFINIPLFAVAPVLYLCVLNFVSPARPFRGKDLLHFITVALMSFLMILFVQVPDDVKIKDVESQSGRQDIMVFFVIIIVPITVYWFLSYKKLITHQKNIRLFASNTEGVDLSWLRYFLGGVALMVVAWIFDILFYVNATSSLLISLIYWTAAFYLAYFALKQGAVFSEKLQETLDIKTIIEESEQTDFPKKQVLNPEQLSILKEKLSDLMLHQKPYLDSELSLPRLASIMQLNTHELSYLINTGFDDNFFNFVNRYRVEESKRILTTPQYQHLSMVGIAFEAGFNSKTAFNTAFKKMVGVSPTEFQKLNIR